MRADAPAVVAEVKRRPRAVGAGARREQIPPRVLRQGARRRQKWENAPRHDLADTERPDLHARVLASSKVSLKR
eukprot:6121342-Pleurochrysis_carterae.AAC.1